MKGCLGIGLVIAAVILTLLGLGAFKLYQGYTAAIDEFPEYARRDVVYAHYNSLIESVNEIIDESQSMHDLAARLEKLTVPDELVYLTLTKQTDHSFDNDKLEIVEKFPVRSSSHTLINGTGLGKLNDVAVIVINLPVNRHSIEDCFMYLRYDKRQHSAD